MNPIPPLPSKCQIYYPYKNIVRQFKFQRYDHSQLQIWTWVLHIPIRFATPHTMMSGPLLCLWALEKPSMCCHKWGLEKLALGKILSWPQYQINGPLPGCDIWHSSGLPSCTTFVLNSNQLCERRKWIHHHRWCVTHGLILSHIREPDSQITSLFLTLLLGFPGDGSPLPPFPWHGGKLSSLKQPSVRGFPGSLGLS